VRVVRSLLGRHKATQNVGERVTQREAASTHLQHATWVLRPRALLAPQAGLLGFSHAKAAFDRLSIAATLGLADSHHVLAFALDGLADPLADR
jgi:hypothetical protein